MDKTNSKQRRTDIIKDLGLAILITGALFTAHFLISI